MEESTHETGSYKTVKVFIFPALWVGFIVMLTAWLWMFKKARSELLPPVIRTRAIECQTDIVHDHNIVVIHPNNDLELINQS